MKKIYYLKLFFLCAIIGATACERKIEESVVDDLSWDISPDSESQVIEKKIEGIVFKFCLLNEQDKPATIFKEGENFSFNFSVTNQSKKDLYYDAYLLSYNKQFLRIYNSSNFDFGKSYEPILHEDIGIVAYPFNDGDVKIIKVPWLHEKQLVLRVEDFRYESIVQKPLAKGFYYTNFKYSFYFQEKQSGNFVRTDSINFKINFKIQ